MRTSLVLLALALLTSTAAADPRPPLDPDDVFTRDDGLVCWEVPREGGCNAYGCWADGGGCNAYGCWNGPRGACNAYGCSDAGECTAYGCPRGRRARPELACAREDEVPVGDSGCNAYGCWSNGGGCNAYGCWQSAYGSCNAYGCAEVGECNAYGCPPAPRARHHRHRR
jgi:hypothetical protein